MATTPTNPSGNGPTIIATIEVAGSLLQGVLSAIPQTAEYTPIIALVEAALGKLTEAQGTPVTYGQLEGFRVKKLW